MPGKLTRLDAFEVTIPLPKPLRLGPMPMVAREYVLVRAYDDDGNVGTSYGLTRNAPISATIARTVTPRWQGQNLDDYADFYTRTVRGNLMLGSHGIFWRALSLADCALHDLMARRAGQTLGEYLGGTMRPVTTTVAGCYPTDEETPESLTALMPVMAGYTDAGIKITSSSDYARDTARLEICRAAIPNGPPFILDLYSAAKDAESLLPEARKWEPYHIDWLEDPFPFDDLDNVTALTRALPYKVGVGDEQTGIHQFRRLIDQCGVGLIRLDATTCGGIRAFMEIAAMAAERGVPVSSHVFHHLHSQLACAVPNLRSIEYMLPESHAESIQALWNSDLQWRDGKLVPGSTPGVGYDWNEEAIAYYRQRG